MSFLYLKALHLIFVVTWFSGMFYLCRLFIYNREAQDKTEMERDILTRQFSIMIRRLLFGITWPSAVLVTLFGLWSLSHYAAIPVWMHIKLGLVLLLLLYHYSLHRIYRQQAAGHFGMSSFQLRLWNEVPTVFLVGIVMLAVVRQNISLVYGLGGLLAFVALLFAAIRVYKALRKA